MGVGWGLSYLKCANSRPATNAPHPDSGYRVTLLIRNTPLLELYSGIMVVLGGVAAGYERDSPVNHDRDYLEKTGMSMIKFAPRGQVGGRGLTRGMRISRMPLMKIA